MSQYIAELLVAAERALPAEREGARAECAAAILDLWAHRSNLPHGARPFEELEGVVLTLRALHQDDVPFYFRQVRWLADVALTHEKAGSFLATARVVDASARSAMQFCITEATSLLRENSDDWLAAAQSPAIPTLPDMDAVAEILIHVTGEHESMARRRHLTQQIQNLTELQGALQTAKDRLAAELATLPDGTS